MILPVRGEKRALRCQNRTTAARVEMPAATRLEREPVRTNAAAPSRMSRTSRASQRSFLVKKKAHSMNGQQKARYVARSFWFTKTLVTA
jgi:hypothetical protein